MGKRVASVSFGKDSLAMLLYIIENKLPLDEVVFYDTGMEFQAIYNVRDKVLPILRDVGVTYTELHPKNSFIYDMLHRPVYSKQKGTHNGYGWCGGVCRWGTTWKTQTIDKYIGDSAELHYIGIAADEPKRLVRLERPKFSILGKIGMDEQNCLMFCRERGFNWNERTEATESGYIDLYDILDRVSCWCCGNKNLKELRNIYHYLPDYWERLKELQSKIERPFRRDGNTVFDLEERFKMEAQNERSVIKQ